MKYILTCNDNSKNHLEDELKHYSIEGTLTWFNETEALFDTTIQQNTFYDLIMDTPLLFIRHFFPVSESMNYEEAISLPNRFEMEASEFSIQLRTPIESRQHFNALRNNWVDAFIEKGNILNVKNPVMIVSVYVSKDTVYAGISHFSQLLSIWSAGAIHFSRALETLSRAEYKLREIFATFPLNLQGEVAVDLGAAPGGWTKALRDMDFEVYAIDPAFLDHRLSSDPLVHHYQMTSQQFVEENPFFECDLIVNDMKMSPQLSIPIFVDAAKQLNPNGYGIITIKLSKFYRFTDALDALETLRKHFEVLYARQLFHNRNEITVIVKPN